MSSPEAIPRQRAICLMSDVSVQRNRKRERGEKEKEKEEREISLSGIWEPACCEWRSSTRRHQPAQTEPNGSPNSVRQFVNSFQSRAHIAIKTRRLFYFPPPSSCLALPCLVLSCFKPKTRIDLDSKIRGKSLQRTTQHGRF